jgi:GMP reductase
MLAGHDEGCGEPVFDDGEQTGVKFYGMSSEAANVKHSGGLKDYRSSEGREVTIPYRGSVSDTVQDILGGIRSACTYVGASELKHLSKCTTFIRVNNQHNRVFEK